MVIAYFDCCSGVAGDMILGALVDAGLPLKYLKEQLSLLPLGSYEIKKVKGKRSLRGTNIHVRVTEDAKSDSYPRLDKMIARSKLSADVRDLSRTMFERLAKAEARVHGTSLKRVHFHEVGAVDSIIDIVGAAIGFDYFGFESIHSSPLPITRGRVRTAHGWLPVPAPATLEILKGVPVEPAPVKEEIVTPTGAAILTSVSENFGDCPIQVVKKVGYGFGDKVIPGIANALRLMIGDGFPAVVIQTSIDDMNPQIYDHLMDQVFRAGAVDIDLAPGQMKKNRPAVKLSVLAPWKKKDAVIDLILRETTTFGVRYWPVDRRVLTRSLVKRKVKHGQVTFKIGYDRDGQAIKAVPEYEDVKRLAKKSGKSLLSVYRELQALERKILGA